MFKDKRTSIKNHYFSIFLKILSEEPTFEVSRKSAHIGYKGGEIVVPNTEVSLIIPSGAIAQRNMVELTVSVLWNGKHPQLNDDQSIITPTVLLEPEGMRFEKPVQLIVPHFSKDPPTSLQVWQKQSKFLYVCF